MSSGNAKQPKLRSSPPPALNTTQSLARLETLKDWTEEPAKKAAAAISKEGQGDGQGNKEKIDPRVPQYPWQAGQTGSTLASFKIPTQLFLKLKFLGDTTYGSNMTKILLEALEPKVEQMLKERGIEP